VYFKGFEDWVEIFRGGRQVDSAGKEHDGDKLIDAALANFDAAKHEPPLCVGHPRDNAPAFGWVAALKAENRGGVRTLMAKCKDVVPAFIEALKQGLYKKRSAAFYPDGSLRHVGFLGAAPPAVKALADLKFNETEFSSFEFSETKRKESGMEFKEVLELLKFWKANTESAIPPAQQADGGHKTFTEDDLEAAKKKAIEEAARNAREKMEAEFAEREAKRTRDAHRQANRVWVEERVAAGKIVPAWEKQGLLAFMDGLDVEQEIQFAEDDRKQSALEWFKAFLDGLPKAVDFKEHATMDKAVNPADDPGEALDLEVAKVMTDKHLQWDAAFAEVQRSHPELVKAYVSTLM
jgi:hypothetical protein